MAQLECHEQGNDAAANSYATCSTLPTWAKLACLRQVAEVLNVPPIRVYEVATFYTMFNRSKMGKYHVMVCGTTPCMLQGARDIYDALKSHLGIDYGQTTEVQTLHSVAVHACAGTSILK